MTFKDLSAKRYSVRSYSGEPVTEEQLQYILECARLAPSAVNLQPWKFYVMTSQQDRELLQQKWKGKLTKKSREKGLTNFWLLKNRYKRRTTKSEHNSYVRTLFCD